MGNGGMLGSMHRFLFESPAERARHRVDELDDLILDREDDLKEFERNVARDERDYETAILAGDATAAREASARRTASEAARNGCARLLASSRANQMALRDAADGAEAAERLQETENAIQDILDSADPDRVAATRAAFNQSKRDVAKLRADALVPLVKENAQLISEVSTLRQLVPAVPLVARAGGNEVR